MTYHSINTEKIINDLNVNPNLGLTGKSVQDSRKKYGKNLLTKRKENGIFSQILSALKEPMLLILIFSLILALGTNLGIYLKTGTADFSECIGIGIAISLSVFITVVMEGSSKRAFRTLSKIYDNVYVKVIRDGATVITSQSDVVLGDVIVLGAGDKIVADGRLISSVDLTVDESALTGESKPAKKNADAVLNTSTVLAERVNMVYSGTFVCSGEAKMIVTAVGDQTEIGKIAHSLGDKKEVSSPLQQKLNKLGKRITIIGVICGALVFIVNLIRLIVSGGLNFSGVQDLFISSVILIVAAVPEGLPTIVAVSLALNMIKLAKENALIKKMIATETTGAVSVICSDKTGTLTLNKLSVECIFNNEFCLNVGKLKNDYLLKNFVLNTTCDVIKNKSGYVYQGSGTECALLVAYMKTNPNETYKSLRQKYKVIDRIPFSSQIKFMQTTVNIDGINVTFIKGAPEVVLEKCNLSDAQKKKLYLSMEKYQKEAKRILCFAHYKDGNNIVYDGFAVLSDKIRPDVKKAVENCDKAGIKVKILTGDNVHTAFAVGKELGIAKNNYQVVTAKEIENMDDITLKKALPNITVIARSTPIIKQRVVKLLKELGEVVAVTGDGINDAPAIKHADVGFAMGKTGSEITKETADVVLLDDSFSTVVKAVAFGRNVYKNLQRFIMFQLSVNVCALLFITVCACVGIPSPFNTLQLLWINVIMDGPPALTLGLERAGDDLMKCKPIKRDISIVSKKMFLRILLNGVVMACVIFLQYVFNFMGVLDSEKPGVVFTLFIVFQLFNAFNSRELGVESILKNLGKNKIMLVTFLLTFIVQILIVTFFGNAFGVGPISVWSWGKILLTGSSIIFITELSKAIFRIIKQKTPKRA